MPRNKIIPYNPKLKQFARELGKNSMLSEALLWRQIKRGVTFISFNDLDVKKNMDGVLRTLKNKINEMRASHPPGSACGETVPLQRGI